MSEGFPAGYIRGVSLQLTQQKYVPDQHSSHPIECFFQEPLYTSSDRDYLRSIGHTVVETPAASRMITPMTMVFTIHLPTREYLGCLAGAVPAMLVGTTFDRYEE